MQVEGGPTSARPDLRYAPNPVAELAFGDPADQDPVLFRQDVEASERAGAVGTRDVNVHSLREVGALGAARLTVVQPVDPPRSPLRRVPCCPSQTAKVGTQAPAPNVLFRDKAATSCAAEITRAVARPRNDERPPLKSPDFGRQQPERQRRRWNTQHDAEHDHCNQLPHFAT